MQFQKYKSISTNSAYPDSLDASTSNAIEPAAGFSTITLPLETPLRLASLSNNNNNNNISSNNYNNNNTSADLASVDSSDTYASCQTHPFTSAGDLTADFAGISCDLDDLDMDNFASNPFERNGATATVNNNCGEAFIARANVKRSASGDGVLHSLGGTPTLEMCQAFQSLDSASAIHRSSEASLNDVPVPKHRKTRFQQGSLNKLKARTATTDAIPIASTSSSSSTQKKLSHDSLTEAGTSAAAYSTLPTTKKNRRASFMPSKSLASATKLINQHLFGIQNNIPKLKGI